MAVRSLASGTDSLEARLRAASVSLDQIDRDDLPRGLRRRLDTVKRLLATAPKAGGSGDLQSISIAEQIVDLYDAVATSE
jgi:hypothetical protein